MISGIQIALDFLGNSPSPLISVEDAHAVGGDLLQLTPHREPLPPPQNL
jgi:hypothetical protein